MKVHLLPACATALAAGLTLMLAPARVLAQAPPDPDPEEALRLEELHIESVATHGHSHASGGRPELGPTILGNPTQAVVLQRVGLIYSFTSTGTFSEFATAHHPLARVSTIYGTVHLIDRSTGHPIGVLEPGMIAKVEPALPPDGSPGGYVVRLDEAVRADGLQGLMVHVNELYDIRLTEEELAAGAVSVDLAGLNVVQYNPVGRDGSATVVVIVD